MDLIELHDRALQGARATECGARVTSRSTASTSASAAATAAALTATLGLAAVSWVIAVRQMNGMDMGVATRLGSFPSFASVWVPMMAAMMLPGAAAAIARAARTARSVPLFILSYLAVWTLVGLAVYAA